MPEGDTIFRVAARLRPALEGGLVDAVELGVPAFDAELVVGQAIVRIEARGKHLLMHLQSGHVIHSHLGMDGAWHLYRRSEPWRKPRAVAAMALAVREFEAACFVPKVLELLTADQFRTHRHLRRLGPDLLGDPFDAMEAVARFRVHDATPLGEAVMNQTIVAGIGNVYKSDVLFLLGYDPFATVSRYSDQELALLLDKARSLLRRNVGAGPRQTRFRGDGRRLWTYSRTGEPCYTCGDIIRLRRQGDAGRTTFWCPTCQPPRLAPPIAPG